MAKNTLDSAPESTPSKLTFDANGAEKISLPAEGFVTDATITRDGNDLHLQSPAGETAVIKNYFAVEDAPLLQSPNGTVLTPQLVNSFASSSQTYAAGDTASDESPVGAAEEVKGNATVTRADGSVETITIGTPIYQGDVVQTDESGAVNIRFLDETSMAVSENARLSIDNYSFDPKTESGETDFSVLRGVFVFTSGLIGRDDPDDVHINTPVGSIGIRGTIIAGAINPAGESTITVLEGAIVVANSQSETTLSQQFETVKLLGFDTPMQEASVLPAADINARFESVSYVVPTLFSTIEDSAKEQGDESNAEQNSLENAPAEEPAETQSEQPAQENAPAETETLLQDQSRGDILDSGLKQSDEANILDTGIKSATSTETNTTTGSLSADTSRPVSGTLSHTTSTAPANYADNQPAPVRTTTTTTTNTGPAALTFTLDNVSFDSDATGGTMIGSLSSNATSQSDVSYIFSDSGSTTSNNGYFEIVGSAGSYHVQLTTSGAMALRTSLDPVNLGTMAIRATHTDTRTADGSYTSVTNDANIALNIDSPTAAGVAHITDNINNGMGYSISAVGDRDGDGFDDFVFTNNTAGQNHIYGVWGDSAELMDGNLTSLISATRAYTEIFDDMGGSDTVISGIGDFNGDGINDYVIGQSDGDSGPDVTGRAAIVTSAGAAGTVSVWGYSGLYGANLGWSVSGIGDFNNDGYADVAIGAPFANIDDGKMYVVKGHESLVDLTDTSTNTTFMSIHTGLADSNFGESIAGVGDMNGDGYADFAVGASEANSGSGQVKFFMGNWGSITAGQIVNGMAGQYLGTELEGVGDLNGDGYSDLLIGAEDNSFKIVYGSNSTVAVRSVDLNSSGYTITGGGAAGDFNGDGYDDFTIALADANGTYIYVVYGKDSHVNILDTNFFKDSNNAFEMYYSGADNADDLEISHVGDINGDGYDDIAIGVPDLNGATAGNGGVIVVNGRDTGNSLRVDTATAMEQSLVGTSNNDIMSDGSYTQTGFRAGAGNDVITLHNGNFTKIDGGSGHDIIRFDGAVGSNIDFSTFNFEEIQRVEGLQYGANNQTMVLTVENLFNLLKSSDDGTFKIDSVMAGSALTIDAASASGSSTTSIVAALNEMGSGATNPATDQPGYNQFNIGGYSLYIDMDVTVNVA